MVASTDVCIAEDVLSLMAGKDSSHLNEAGVFGFELLKKNFLRKLKPFKPDPQVNINTWKAFFESEQQCFATNQRLSSLTDFCPLGQVLNEVRSLIQGVIGSSPPKNILVGTGRFSPGASFETRRGDHFSRKMEEMTVTSPVSYMLTSFLGITTNLKVVRGCKTCSVPKDSRVNRLIAIEPSGNAFLQQSVGAFIRRKLLSVNIDLNDQRPNQSGAFHALVDDLCTIDLARASDSISIELVRAVLPHDWFLLLDALRSPLVRLDASNPSGTEKWFLLSKFSSMGNGFTFELESLIFWAISKFVNPSFNPLIYGDDIVVRQSDSSNLIRLLTACGFETNLEKTFLSGRYFESCGKHYYDLEDVTPAYQKARLTNLFEAVRCHNRLIRWARRGPGRYRLIRQSVALIREVWPSEATIPFGVERDDGYLVDPRLLRTNKNGDYVCKVLQTFTRDYRYWNEDNAYLYKLYNTAHQNETPSGHVENAVPPDYGTVVRQTVIWASSLTA